MARDWNGLDLQTRFSELLGDTDTAFKARVMEWINDIIIDMSVKHDWGTLKVEGRVLLTPGEFEQDLELPQPNAPTIAISSGGSLADTSIYSVIITLFEKTTGIESIAGKQSADVTATSVNKTVTLTDIPRSIHPLVTSRRIYLIKDSGSPLFVKEIQDNTSTSTTITAESTSLIEPPDRGYIKTISGNLRETNQRYLRHRPIDQIMLERDGTPNEGSLRSWDYLSNDRIFVEPKPEGFGTVTEDYDTSGDFTFDSDKVEFVNGEACLKDQTPIDAKLGATYTTDKDLANWSAGSLVGTLAGGATVAGGALSMKGADGKHATYVATGMINPLKGTIRVKYTPNYTGNPAADKVVWDFSDSSGSNNNRIRLRQDTASSWRVDSWSNIGTVRMAGVGFGTTSLTAGVTVELEFNYDFTVGSETKRLFFNGVQSGGTNTTTGPMDDDLTSVTYLQIGSQTVSDQSVQEIVIFDEVQHTAGYTTPSANVAETKFFNDFTSVVLTAAIIASAIDVFSTTVTEPANTEIKYAITVEGVVKYWDGTHWATSDETGAQLNVLGVIQDNIDSVIDVANAEVQIYVALKSTNGLNSPCISQHVLGCKTTLTDLSFYYFKIPREIFAAVDSVPDFQPLLKEVLEAGVEYKGNKYRDREGTAGKFNTYQALLRDSISELGLRARTRQRTRDVVGDANAETLTFT